MSEPGIQELGILGYGEGGGCACKADWRLLDGLADLALFREAAGSQVGLHDASMVRLGPGKLMTATVDFVGPVSRNAADYGFVAVAHALSDLFAVGVTPAFALVIAAWPREDVVASDLRQALDGMHEALVAAGAQVLGGHTAYSDQPLLGVAAFGVGGERRAQPKISAGDALYLSKPLGTGVAIGAMRERNCPEGLETAALASMRTMNTVGLELAGVPGVKLVSDVTGFGLVGQAMRLADETGLSAVIEGGLLPELAGVRDMIRRGAGGSAAERNWGLFRSSLSSSSWVDSVLASDPQTNGPLLVVADASLEPGALPEGLVKIGSLLADQSSRVVIC